MNLDPSIPATAEKKSKHAPKRTAAQRAADLRFIEEHHLRGKTHARIAEMLSIERGYTISRQQVAYDLKGLANEWAAEAKDLVTLAKARSLKSLALLESAAWDAWDASRRSTDGLVVSDNTGTRAKNGKANDAGDPAYMKIILEVHEHRVRLLGLEKTLDTGNQGPGCIPQQGSNSPLTEEVQQAILERYYRRTRGSEYVPRAASWNTNRKSSSTPDDRPWTVAGD